MNKEQFINYLNELGISITDEQFKLLDKYYELIIEWNQKINLTAITEKELVYLKHFYDCLTLNKIIDLDKELSLIDIGSGAGFPGIVLKIMFPKLRVTLIDSLNKRVTFLNTVIAELQLKNINVIHARAEDYAKLHREQYDIATARAVAPLRILLEYSIPLVKVGGFFIAMKSDVSEELLASKKIMSLLDSNVDQVLSFELPIEKSKRTLIKFNKIRATNPRFPRKYSEIKRKTI